MMTMAMIIMITVKTMIIIMTLFPPLCGPSTPSCKMLMEMTMLMMLLLIGRTIMEHTSYTQAMQANEANRVFHISIITHQCRTQR